MTQTTEQQALALVQAETGLTYTSFARVPNDICKDLFPVVIRLRDAAIERRDAAKQAHAADMQRVSDAVKEIFAFPSLQTPFLEQRLKPFLIVQHCDPLVEALQDARESTLGFTASDDEMAEFIRAALAKHNLKIVTKERL